MDTARRRYANPLSLSLSLSVSVCLCLSLSTVCAPGVGSRADADVRGTICVGESSLARIRRVHMHRTVVAWRSADAGKASGVPSKRRRRCRCGGVLPCAEQRWREAEEVPALAIVKAADNNARAAVSVLVRPGVALVRECDREGHVNEGVAC